MKYKRYRRAEGPEWTKKCPPEAFVQSDEIFVYSCCTSEFNIWLKKTSEKENRYWPIMVEWYPETLQVTKGLAFLEPLIPKFRISGDTLYDNKILIYKWSYCYSRRVAKLPRINRHSGTCVSGLALHFQHFRISTHSWPVPNSLSTGQFINYTNSLVQHKPIKFQYDSTTGASRGHFSVNSDPSVRRQHFAFTEGSGYWCW